MKRLFMDYLRDEEGQTSVEYILLMAVVVLIVLKFKQTASSKLNALVDMVFSKSSDAIEKEFNSMSN